MARFRNSIVGKPPQTDEMRTPIRNDLAAFAVGSLELLFDRETLFIRRIRWRGVEAIRAIYAAVRDQSWATIPAKITKLVTRELPESVAIDFSAECRAQEIHYVYEAKIVATAASVRFDFQGEARSDFFRNRIGLCVLHPTELCAGKRCDVEHTGSGKERGLFPDFIAPHQPFKNIRQLRYAVDAACEVEIEFEGDVFEMEDQRNWTDASFKTYCTPLALPLPKQVRAGEKVAQSVVVRFIESGPTSPARAVHTTGEREATRIFVDFESRRVKPRIGFVLNGLLSEVSDLALSKLGALHPDHLRVDCRFTNSEWRRDFLKAAEIAAQVRASLHVALFLAADRTRSLGEIQQLIPKLPAPVKLWLVFDEGRSCTTPESAQLARSMLGSFSSGARFAGGTQANFTEVNRERPPSSADWLCCFPINPQVHATDNLSLVENLEAQRDVLRSASVFTKEPVVVSPVRLLPRGASEGAQRVDERQAGPFAAAWTLGSIAALSERETFSLTYFDAFGPAGIMDNMGEVYPVYGTFQAVAALQELAHVAIEAEDRVKISGLAGVAREGKLLLLVANHCDREQTAAIQWTVGPDRGETRKETREERIPPLAVRRIELEK